MTPPITRESIEAALNAAFRAVLARHPELAGRS